MDLCESGAIKMCRLGPKLASFPGNRVHGASNVEPEWNQQQIWHRTGKCWPCAPSFVVFFSFANYFVFFFVESILFLALTLALHITFCQYQFMFLKVILKGICANMNILKYNLCTILLKYSITKNLAPAMALLGRYRSARAMHRSSAGSEGRILRIFPQYLRIFPHGVTTIRCQLFGKKFPQQNACLTLKFIEETVIYTFL